MRLTACALMSTIALGCSLLAMGCQGPTVGKCEPTFPYLGGWLGADDAYSVPLDATHSLWLFGDSFVGAATQTTRAGATMIHNTVGLSTCDAGTGAWTISYFWPGAGSASPKSFFDPGAGAGYYFWPMDGFTANGNAYVSLYKVQNTNSGGTFAFKIIGTTLAKVTGQNPASATVSLQDVSSAADVFPGISTVVNGEFIYMYGATMGSVGGIAKPTVLSRFALAGLADAKNHLEYFAADGTWKPGLVVADCMPMFAPGPSELTVRFHADLGKWVAVYSDPAFFSKKILMRTAATLEGPWSDAQSVYEVPEMLAATAGYDSETFCYAAKEHVEFGGDGALVLTYACNSLTFSKAVNNMNIYLPKATTYTY